MKNIKLILIVLVGCISFVSCESNTTQDLEAKVALPTYNNDISPVIAAKCTGCHSGGNQYPDLDTYATFKEACANGNVLCRLDASCGNIMPQDGPLPQATIDMIKTWATNNYPN